MHNLSRRGEHNFHIGREQQLQQSGNGKKDRENAVFGSGHREFQVIAMPFGLKNEVGQF